MTQDSPFFKELKAIVGLSLPVVGSQLCFMGINVTDTMMAGRLSPRDLAAVAVGGSYSMPFYLVCLGVLMVLNPIVAHLFGAGKHEEMGNKLHQSLWLSLLLSLPAMAALLLAEPLLLKMGIERDVAGLAADYLRNFSLAFPFAFCFMSLRFFCEGLAIVKPTMVILLLAVPLNIAANYVFMYGQFGFPALGAAGTGLASTCVNIFMFLALWWWTWRKLGQRYDLARWVKPRLADLREQLAIGLPNGVSLGMEITMFALVALFIASMGETEVGSHQVALNIASCVYMIPLGISLALGIRVGQAVGRGDMPGVAVMGKAGLSLTIAIQVLLALAIAVGADELVGLYTRDAGVHVLASRLLLLAAVFQLSDGLQVVGMGALRGLKDTKVPMLANVVAYWGVGLPLGYGLGFTKEMGPAGFWLGLVGGLTLAAILHNWRFFLLIRRSRNLAVL